MELPSPNITTSIYTPLPSERSRLPLCTFAPQQSTLGCDGIEFFLVGDHWIGELSHTGMDKSFFSLYFLTATRGCKLLWILATQRLAAPSPSISHIHVHVPRLMLYSRWYWLILDMAPHMYRITVNKNDQTLVSTCFNHLSDFHWVEVWHGLARWTSICLSPNKSSIFAGVVVGRFFAGNEVGTSSGSLEVPGGGVSAGCAQGSSTQSGWGSPSRSTKCYLDFRCMETIVLWCFMRICCIQKKSIDDIDIHFNC